MNIKAGLFALGLVGGAVALRSTLRRRRAIDFVGRTVLITGGSRGLGLSLARKLAERGANLAICGRDAAALERAALELRARGCPVLARAVDLSDRAQAEAFVDEVAAHFGRIDVLINNAGVIQVGSIADSPVERFEEVMGSNFFAPLQVTLRALPHLRQQGADARIVNITSLGGRIGMPHLTSYGASKFALVGFSETLRAELDAEGDAPRVVTVIPGLMRTGSFYNAEFLGQREQELAWFSLGASMPGLAIDGEEAARRILTAASDGRAFLTLGFSGHAVDLLHRVSPRLAVAALSLAARLLPKPASEPTSPAKGRDVESLLPKMWPITLGDEAARMNNEEPREAHGLVGGS